MLSILHSPHQYVKINGTLTVRELKSMIIQNYNEGNSDDIKEIKIVGYENDDDNIKKSNFVTCANGNIYRRLDSGIVPEPHYLPLACALFSYQEFDATKAAELSPRICYPSRPASEILPFFILNKTARGDINIMLLKPRQMNWRFGPTLPQMYYQLDSNGSLNIYNEDDGSDIITNQNKTYRFKNRRERIINNVDTQLLRSSEYYANMTWKSAGECQVCYARPINVMFTSCKHCVVCDTCAIQLKACTRCTASITGILECIDPKSYQQ